MIVIFKSELSPQVTFKKTETIKTTKPVSVNIDLDSKFNNFKSHTGLTFEILPCQLYEELSKYTYIQISILVQLGNWLQGVMIVLQLNSYYL